MAQPEKNCEVLVQALLEESTKLNIPSDDMTLVHASKNGDLTDFGELVKRYDRKLLRIAQNVMQNQEDAVDAVQEAFLKAYLIWINFRSRRNSQPG